MHTELGSLLLRYLGFEGSHRDLGFQVQGVEGETERVLGFSESEKEKKISGEILVVVLGPRRFPANFRGGANKMSESEEASEYVCSEDESSQTEGFVEGLIEARMVVHEGEMAGPSVESGSEAYREMQKKYKVLEASVDRVLALAHTPEVGSSNQTSPSESVGIAVASASEGVDIRVGVPLGKRNTLTEAKLVELRTDYSVPPYIGLRLPSAANVVRYPPEGSVMIFTDMYQHGLRLPFHPWVQMMLAKLGYAPRQYNPNFWLLLHGVYIA
ncbi:unnamed protein product [Prunus armeniaca]